MIQKSLSLRLRPRAAGGFTLIEVLMSVLVIALGCLVVVHMQVMAMGSGTQADSLTVASFLAETQMELFRSQPMTEISTGTSYLCCTRLGECESRSQNDSCTTGDYLYGVDSEVFDNEPTSRSLTLKLHIKWRDVNGWRSMDYKAAVTDFSFS